MEHSERRRSRERGTQGRSEHASGPTGATGGDTCALPPALRGRSLRPPPPVDADRGPEAGVLVPSVATTSDGVAMRSTRPTLSLRSPRSDHPVTPVAPVAIADRGWSVAAEGRRSGCGPRWSWPPPWSAR